MAYIICEPCIGTKDTACVDVCPVDCIHPRKDEPAYATAEMLYIHPDECIDCGVCVPECPAEAIFSDSDIPADSHWFGLNRKYAGLWPNIVGKGVPPPDANAWNGVPNKFSEHFSSQAGEPEGSSKPPAAEFAR